MKNNQYQKLAGRFKAIDDLIKMKLLKIDFENNNVHFFSKALWMMKDKKFKINFCKNIYIYYRIKSKKPDDKISLSFIDIEDEKHVAVCSGEKVTLMD